MTSAKTLANQFRLPLLALCWLFVVGTGVFVAIGGALAFDLMVNGACPR